MLSRRFVKRTVYILGFFTFILLIGGFLLFLVRSDEPPVVVERPVEYQEVIKEDVSIVHHQRSIDVVARLRNPNVRAGVARYPVTFVLLDSREQEIATHTENTYLLPGAVKYVVALNIPTGGHHVGGVRVELPGEPNFSEIPATVSMPTFSSFLQDRNIRTVGNRNIEEQRGLVENTSTFDWKRVEVVGVALDLEGNVVGASQTFVGELTIGEQRDFILQWPAPQLKTDRVIVLPSTNVYLEENVVNVIGDPSLLR